MNEPKSILDNPFLKASAVLQLRNSVGREFQILMHLLLKLNLPLSRRNLDGYKLVFKQDLVIPDEIVKKLSHDRRLFRIILKQRIASNLILRSSNLSKFRYAKR